MNPFNFKLVYKRTLNVGETSFSTIDAVNEAISKNQGLSSDKLNELISKYGGGIKDALIADFRPRGEFIEASVDKFSQSDSPPFIWHLEFTLTSPVYTCIDIKLDKGDGTERTTIVCHKTDNPEIKFIPLGELQMVRVTD